MPRETATGMFMVEVLPCRQDGFTVLSTGWLQNEEWETIDAWLAKNVSPDEIVKGITSVAFTTYDDALLFYMAFAKKK